MEHKSGELRTLEIAAELRNFTSDRVLVYLLLSSLLLHVTGAHYSAPQQLLPFLIESWNGSPVDMGCPMLVNISDDTDKANMACGGGCNSSTVGVLVDGNLPVLNMSDPNWASELMISRKVPTEASIYQFDTALLGFRFDEPVLPSAVELDIFNCPTLGIGIHRAEVFSNDNERMELILRHGGRGAKSLSPTSCDSLVTITIDIHGRKLFRSWYVMMTFYNLAVDYIGVGEVRFVNLSTNTSAENSSIVCSDPLFSPLSSSSAVIEISTSSIVQEYDITTTSMFRQQEATSIFPSSSGIYTIILNHRDPEETVGMRTPSPPVEFPLIFVFIGAAGGMMLVVLLLGIILCCVAFRKRCSQKVALRSPFHGNRRDNTFDPVLVPLSVPLPPTPQPVDTKTNSNGAVRQSLYEHISENPEPSEPLYFTLNEIRHSVVLHATNHAYSESPVDDASPLVPSAASDDAEMCILEPQLDPYVEMNSVRPAVRPTVRPDVEQVLSQRMNINEGIYSETIAPSDFTSCDASREASSDGGCDFLAPIYPSRSALPQCFKTVVEISEEKFTEMEKLRIGQFGHTVLASTVDLSLKSLGLNERDNRTINLLVAVKRLHLGSSTLEVENFIKETEFVSRLDNPNILRYLGVCYSTYFIMMEYMEEGDLNQFLRKYSEIVSNVLPSPANQGQVNISTLVHIASQIANGMQYLASLTFIHRDLATRNCYIGANTVVKVGDLGVDMDRYQTHYYPIQGRKLLPIRWMSPECFSGKFSEKSDVWAFGVTMWELFTLAKVLPYPHLADEEVVQMAVSEQSHELLSKPDSCTEPLYQIMQRCWAMDMKKRITFSEIHELLRHHV